MLADSQLLTVTVLGDVHGHFEQLAELLLYCGGPAETPMLFLGDYVNRGYFSLKVQPFLDCVEI